MAFFRPLSFNSEPTSYFDTGLDIVPTYTSIDYLKNSDVFTAVNVIANDIATNPIKLEAKNINHIADVDQLDYLLNVKPNEQMSARYFKYAMAVNLLLNGNAYARIYKLENGEVMELQLLQPSWVQVIQNEDNGDYLYEISDYTHSPYKVKKEEILHVRYFTTNGIVGQSPLYALNDEVRLQRGGNGLLKDFFESGVNGSGIIKINKGHLAADARNNIRQAWLEANGANNKSRLIVQDSTEDYQPIQIDTSVLKIVNSNDYTTKQIAKAFGVPVSRLGLENAHTSLPQSNLDYIQNSLDHYFSMFTSEMNIKLLSRGRSKKYKFEFDVSRLMELDAEKNMQLTLDWYKSGLIDDTEARRRIGYVPYDDKMNGKRVVISNFIPLENIESNYPNNVIVGNAYDDTGKPVGKEKMSKPKQDLEAMKGGDKENDSTNGD